jgi:hypothetical protein
MSAEHREQLEEAIERVANVHLLAVKQIQEAYPDLRFQDAWDKAQRESPSAFPEQDLSSWLEPKVAQSAFRAPVLRAVTPAPILVEGVKRGLVTDIAEPPEDDKGAPPAGEPVATFKREYKDPDAQLVALLGALLLAGLVAKRALILGYIAENGPSRAMVFAEKTLDSGWAPYFEKTSALLTSAATRAAHETIQGSKLLVGPELMRRAENHAVVIAKTEAA